MSMDSYDILVVGLSITLFILLVCIIVAIVIVIKILSELKKIVLKAEGVIDNVEQASNLFKKSAAPMVLTRLVANIVEAVTQNRSSKNSKKDDSKKD